MFHNVPGTLRTGRGRTLRAPARLLNAGAVQLQGAEEGIVGSLNTVLLCGRSPECFFASVHRRCTIVSYSRPHTRPSPPDFGPVLENNLDGVM